MEISLTKSTKLLLDYSKGSKRRDLYGLVDIFCFLGKVQVNPNSSQNHLPQFNLFISWGGN